MAAVEVEVGVEVMGYLQAGLFEAVKGFSVGQQLRFEGAPAGFGLGVIVRITRPAEAGQRAGLFDAGTARLAGVLAAAVGVDNGVLVTTEYCWRIGFGVKGLFSEAS